MLLFDLLLDQMAVGIVAVRYDPNPWFHGALLLMEVRPRLLDWSRKPG
jgi:hypothetical protein